MPSNRAVLPAALAPCSPSPTVIADAGEPFHFTIPFPARVSPDLERARTRHLAWVEEQGLWPTPKAEAVFLATDFPLFVALAHPKLKGDGLDLMTDLVGWAWLWDDSLDKPGRRQADVPRTAAVLNAYRDILYGRTQSTADVPLMATWRHLLARLAERTSHDWRTRHEAHWEATYQSYLQEARNNAAGIIPSFEEYLPMRRSTGGMEICLQWAEAAGCYRLPHHLYTSPALIALREDEWDVLAMVNDLFSVRKEWSEGNTDNVVYVLAQQEQCSRTDAVRIVEDMIAGRLVHFQETESQFIASPLYRDLSSQDHSNADRYIDVMKDWMRANFDWHLLNPRYLQPA